MIPKNDPETCHRNFDPPQRGWLLRFGTPRGIIWMGTWITIHPWRILHASGAISVHSYFSAGKPQTRAFRCEDEDSTDWATPLPICFRKHTQFLNKISGTAIHKVGYDIHLMVITPKSNSQKFPSNCKDMWNIYRFLFNTNI